MCRHFQNLNETDLFHDTRKHIDIWPMDLSNSLEFSTTDQSVLFLLQIACIVHMTDNWKKLKLRLFHFCLDEDKQEEIRNLLENLRIRGETVLCRDRPDQDYLGIPSVNRFLKSESKLYFIADIKCELRREKCANTAVLFLSLPRTPENEQDNERYLDQLSQLTQDLPPVLLVHGVHPVVTTNI